MTDRPLRSVTVAALAVGALIVAQMPTFLTAGVAVQIQQDLRFGPSALGAVLAGSLAASSLGSITLGRVVQTIGWSRGLRAAAVASALTMAGIGAFARSWVWLTVILVLGGVAKAVGHPAANLVVAAEGSPRHQGLLFGLKQAGVPATTTLAGLAVPAIAVTLGWRAAFFLAAGLTVVYAIAIPSRTSRRAPPADAAEQRRDSRDVDRRHLLLLALGAGLGVSVANCVAAFLTTYAVEIGFSPSSAGFLLALVSALGLTVRVLLGWLSDRWVLGLGTVSALILAGACGVVLLSVGTRTWAVVGALLGIGAGWGWAGLFNRAVVEGNRDAPATATGFTQMGVFAGAGLGPLAFGLVAEHASYRTAWLALALVGLCSAAVMLLDRSAGRHVPDLTT